LDNEPTRLLEVDGVGKVKLQEIMNSYLANRAARDTVAFLTPFGITAKRAVKLYQEYGSKTIETVKNNPYCLCDLAGIGFLTADDIAKKIGMDELAPERADAALLYTLKHAETDGHLCLEKRKFIEDTLELLHTREFTAEMLANRAARLVHSGELEIYDEFVYREKTSKAETGLARLIKGQLRCMHGKTYVNLDGEIEAEEQKLEIRFADEQKEAVKKSCQRCFQAIRIDINSEFDVLYAFLEKLPAVLNAGGRVAILTFHSGEDRLVKKAFQALYRTGIYSDIAHDVIRPTAEECVRNSRAKSTKMRWAIRSDMEY
jgi:hypothetical protein